MGDSKKQKRAKAKTAAQARANVPKPRYGDVPVEAGKLAPYNSYGSPAFVSRGYYVDLPFRCEACGVAQVWTATQQKWWYEVAKGYVYSGATRCRACRRKVREASAESRRVHMEGLARKQQR